MLWYISVPSPTLFACLLTFCLGTDLIDGYLARRWNVQSKLGAVLDTVADLGGIACATLGLWVLHRPLLSAYEVPFALLAMCYLAAQVCSLIVRRMPATFSGSLGRPAMAALAAFAAGLTVSFTPAWLVYGVCVVGAACAAQEVARVSRLRMSGELHTDEVHA